MKTALDLKAYLNTIDDDVLSTLEVAALYTEDFGSDEFDVGVTEHTLEIVGSAEHV